MCSVHSFVFPSVLIITYVYMYQTGGLVGSKMRKFTNVLQVVLLLWNTFTCVAKSASWSTLVFLLSLLVCQCTRSLANLPATPLLYLASHAVIVLCSVNTCSLKCHYHMHRNYICNNCIPVALLTNLQRWGLHQVALLPAHQVAIKVILLALSSALPT